MVRVRPSDQEVQLIARVLEFPDVDVPVRAGQVRELAAPLKHASASNLGVGCEVIVIVEPGDAVPAHVSSHGDENNAAEQRLRRLRGASGGLLFGRRGTVLGVDLEARTVDVSFVVPERPGRAEQRFERSVPEACVQRPDRLQFWRNAVDDPGESGNDANVVDQGDAQTSVGKPRDLFADPPRSYVMLTHSATSPLARSRAPTVQKMDDLRRPPRRNPEEHPDEVLERQRKNLQRHVLWVLCVLRVCVSFVALWCGVRSKTSID